MYDVKAMQYPIESCVLRKLNEPFAAGFYEERNASMIKRYARALKRYAENIDSLPASAAPLYPAAQFSLWSLNDAAVSFNYSFSLGFNAELFTEKIENSVMGDREKHIAGLLSYDLTNMTSKPLAQKYCVGGAGYTHSILDYSRILNDGLPEYGKRIVHARAGAKDEKTEEFFDAAQDTFDAVMLLLNKAVGACPDGALKTALTSVTQRSPETFYEALVLINFMFYVDGCDSIGALDRYLSPFYHRDLTAGTMTASDAKALLGAFFDNVDANSGWHMILGGEGADEAFTVMCLQSQTTRRPNSGLKITADTSAAVWDAAFDCLQSGSASPSFYNDSAYRKGAVEFAGVTEEDLPYIAYGGCTEFMVEGRSNVGSIDAGINLLQILEGATLAEFGSVESFTDFMERFKLDIRRQVEMMIAETRLNQEYKAIYRPQPIRTLFVADCLDRATEYNRGGARYNGGVINVAGIANVANSLYAMRAVLSGSIDITRQQLIEALANDFDGCTELHEQLLGLPKFGNNVEGVDKLAKEITEFTFDNITRHRGWRADGFMIPSTIMFTTYTREGQDIQATPDGRKAGTAIADSCGPMQGTDTEGPTSMLTSTALLPQHHGLGTMILNLRVSARMIGDPGMRAKLKALLLSYFDLGGMQIQVTVLDAEQLKAAIADPDAYENLIVRIGGYTEYFNRLGEALQLEVLKRTEHL